MIVMEVQPDLTVGYDLRVLTQPEQLIVSFRRDLRSLMRMHAHGRDDLFVPFGQPDGAVEFRRSVAGPYTKDAVDAGILGAFKHAIEIAREFLVVEVAVGIDESHLYYLSGIT